MTSLRDKVLEIIRRYSERRVMRFHSLEVDKHSFGLRTYRKLEERAWKHQAKEDSQLKKLLEAL